MVGMDNKFDQNFGIKEICLFSFNMDDFGIIEICRNERVVISEAIVNHGKDFW